MIPVMKEKRSSPAYGQPVGVVVENDERETAVGSLVVMERIASCDSIREEQRWQKPFYASSSITVAGVLPAKSGAL